MGRGGWGRKRRRETERGATFLSSLFNPCRTSKSFLYVGFLTRFFLPPAQNHVTFFQRGDERGREDRTDPIKLDRSLSLSSFHLSSLLLLLLNRSGSTWNLVVAVAATTHRVQDSFIRGGGGGGGSDSGKRCSMLCLHVLERSLCLTQLCVCAKHVTIIGKGGR